MGHFLALVECFWHNLRLYDHMIRELREEKVSQERMIIVVIYKSYSTCSLMTFLEVFFLTYELFFHPFVTFEPHYCVPR